ncbi:hypothetical protein TWF217_007368 [Orbilia oligospora]|nr:hypothetical protein TWF217_007368 [Orbilia oligospora]
MAFRKSHGPLQSSEFWKRREKITITSIALHLGCFLLWRWRSIAERYSNQGPIALKPRCLSNGVPLIQNQAITVPPRQSRYFGTSPVSTFRPRPVPFIGKTPNPLGTKNKNGV